MSTNFGSAGIPGTRLKVCGGWWGGGGGGGWITYPVPYNTSPRLGAGALMLNAWTGLLQQIRKFQFGEIKLGRLILISYNFKNRLKFLRSKLQSLI